MHPMWAAHAARGPARDGPDGLRCSKLKPASQRVVCTRVWRLGVWVSCVCDVFCHAIYVISRVVAMDV